METITIQKMWPLGDKANGGFVGTDGKNYKCEAATHALLREGMTFQSNIKPSDWQGKTYYWLPRGFVPPASAREQAPAPTPAASNSPAQAGNNPYVPEMEKQGYIMCSVIMKILADAQTQAGSPPNTEDMGLIAQCAVQTWNQHLKGKV